MHLLGYTFKGLMYFDVVLSMGLSLACCIAQAISSALMYIYRRLSFEGLNYIDNLGAAGKIKRAAAAYDALGKILNDLNIEEAGAKACPPSPVMIFLGIKYDTNRMTIELTKDRAVELHDLLSHWLNKKQASLRECQSLLGKLSFACSMVRSGRVFLSRIIGFIKTFDDVKTILDIPVTVTQDVQWWYKFMNQYDGISIMPEVRWHTVDAKISTDSCLSACGGWSLGEYYNAVYPADIVSQPDISINELKCLAVVIAVKRWGSNYRNKNLLLHCNNKSTVEVINHGNAKNEFSQACLRELVWLCAHFNLWVKVKFLPGVDNRFADLCSRFSPFL